jgi:urease accessory protein
MTLPAATEPNIHPGWKAELHLGFRVGHDRTILAENSHFGPLRVQQPLYPEGPVCHACILHPPGGVVGGDELLIDVKVEPSAHALSTTPGATKFYRTDGRKAVQRQQLQIDNATFEWFPQDTILFPGAEAELETRIELTGEARFIGWEVICLGLPTRNETFAPGTLKNKLAVYRENKPLFIDQLRVSCAKDLDSPAGLRSFPVVATFLATGVQSPPIDELRELMPENNQEQLTGFTLQHDLLIGRFLGYSTFAARNIFQTIWTKLRPAIAGRQACPPRIWST